MENKHWFPLKHELPDGSRLIQLLHGGCDWRIYRLDNKKSMLVVQITLAHRWMESNLLPDTVWESFSFGQDHYLAVTSEPWHRLEPVAANCSPDTKADALSFAVSFRESRKVSSAPLHDAIYVERFSRLLPTWSVSEGSTDEEILGQWLTGGVSIPVTSFRRLSSLLGWLGKKDVAELVLAAGFSVPQGAAGAPTPTTTAGAKPSTRSRQPFCLPGRPVLEAFFKDHVIHVVEHAERYRRFGIAFPAAIVLHGPPGCGKTFAVERLGEHLGWPVFPIDSNSIASRYIHDTSKKIGEVFDRAMDAAPSLIVIDEMEAYLSDRQIHHSTGLHHVEEVGEFLRRIPEAGQGQVLVIGMTNRREMIDAAILRRGRFDHVIEVGMPSAAETAELIKVLLADLPVEGTVDTEATAAALTGRPPSDIAFVIREAARLAARAGQSTLDDEMVQRALTCLQAHPPKASCNGHRL